MYDLIDYFCELRIAFNKSAVEVAQHSGSVLAPQPAAPGLYLDDAEIF